MLKKTQRFCVLLTVWSFSTSLKCAWQSDKQLFQCNIICQHSLKGGTVLNTFCVRTETDFIWNKSRKWLDSLKILNQQCNSQGQHITAVLCTLLPNINFPIHEPEKLNEELAMHELLKQIKFQLGRTALSYNQHSVYIHLSDISYLTSLTISHTDKKTLSEHRSKHSLLMRGRPPNNYTTMS